MSPIYFDPPGKTDWTEVAVAVAWILVAVLAGVAIAVAR